jgi:hypothetical protein
LVDVSAHRFGTFLAGTFLLGLSQLRPAQMTRCAWPVILFRSMGVLLLVVGIGWFFAWRDELSLPGYIGVANAKTSATIENRGHRYAEAFAAASQGLDWAPLDWQLFFIRGVARLGLRQPAREALADFRRARFLEPSAYELPFAEGEAWLGAQPTFALSAWHEALRRRLTDPAGLYSQMFPLAKEFDRGVLPGLADFASEDPRLTIIYLESLGGADFTAALQKLLARDPTLAQLNATEKTRLFALWSEREQLDDLQRAVAAHPEWLPFAWPGLARWQAAQGHYEQAWKLVRRFAVAPPLPNEKSSATIAQLEQEIYANPDDYAAGYALYRAQTSAGKTDDGLGILRHLTARSNAPAYFDYLEAEAWAARGDWQRAWQSWRDFREKTER